MTAIACLLSVSNSAHATALEDAVAAYNTEAASLQTSWDNFQTAQSAAFDDVEDYFQSLYAYIYYLGINQSLADSHWDDMEDAMDRLEATTITPADSTLATLLADLDGATSALDMVMQRDTSDTSNVAYVCGSNHLSISEQPFIFWNDSNHPGIDEWVEFDFPSLCVGNNTNTAYTGPMFNLWVALVDGISGSWASLSVFLNKNKDKGNELNADGASKWDELCAACAIFDYSQPADACFTEEKIEAWCTENASCGDSLSDRAKNQEVNEVFRDFWMPGQLNEVEDALADGIKPWWYDLITWL